MERKVILSNRPEFLDEWTIKNLIPRVNFVSFHVNPANGTKAIVETETQEQALQVVQELHGREISGSTVQASSMGICTKGEVCFIYF